MMVGWLTSAVAWSSSSPASAGVWPGLPAAAGVPGGVTAAAGLVGDSDWDRGSGVAVAK